MEHWAELAAGGRVLVDVRRRANARRLSLRVNQTDGRVSVSAPKWVSQREIDRFLREHQSWLDNALDGVAERETASFGVRLPIEGVEVEIVPTGASRGAARLVGEELQVPGNDADAPARVRAFLKARARDRLVEQSSRFAAALDRPFSKVTLRDPRSRWGSCSSSGRLMYSWRLILAPPEVLTYVAAHEVAHLVEMNHSRRFWANVEALMPEYAAPRRWLREHGKGLHRWDFEVAS